jgi:lysophospholipase L1-like esterase
MKKIIIALMILIVIVGLVLSLKHKSSHHQKTVSYSGNYIALGDSVSAGDGLLYDYDSSACNRTNQSYPSILASHLNLKLYFLACSGATFSQGINGPQDVNDLTIASQISQLPNLPKPKIITLTAGANDADWIGNITSCYLGNCGGPEQTLVTNQKISAVGQSLTKTLNSIQSIYKNNPPTVIVTSYYDPFSSKNLSCSDVYKLTPDDASFLDSELNNLDNQIEQTTKSFSFVKFVSLNFSGHELCTSNPWVQGLTDNAPFHPNSDGQAYIESIIKMTLESN